MVDILGTFKFQLWTLFQNIKVEWWKSRSLAYKCNFISKNILVDTSQVHGFPESMVILIFDNFLKSRQTVSKNIWTYLHMNREYTNIKVICWKNSQNLKHIRDQEIIKQQSFLVQYTLCTLYKMLRQQDRIIWEY